MTVKLDALAVDSSVSGFMVSNEYCDCAAIKGGGVACWGSSYYGCRGDGVYSGSNTDFSNPVMVVGLPATSKPTQLIPGAALVNGTEYIWMRSPSATATPVPIPGTVKKIKDGCAINNAGALYCWGTNRQSTDTFGDNTSNSYSFQNPVMIGYAGGQLLNSGVTDVAMSTNGFNFAAQNGNLVRWGVSETSDPVYPWVVSGYSGIQKVWVSRLSYGYALDNSGNLFAFGSNYYGNYGNGTKSSSTTVSMPATPVQVKIPDPVVDLAIDYSGSECALTNQGDAWCWGMNYYWTLGNGSSSANYTPAIVLGGLKFVSISTDSRQMYGLTSSGDLYSWGGSYKTPTLVQSNVQAISTSFFANGGNGFNAHQAEQYPKTSLQSFSWLGSSASVYYQAPHLLK